MVPLGKVTAPKPFVLPSEKCALSRSPCRPVLHARQTRSKAHAWAGAAVRCAGLNRN